MITTATVDDGDRREYILVDEEPEIRECFFKTIPLFALNEMHVPSPGNLMQLFMQF
jgi:hypothetical protein